MEYFNFYFDETFHDRKITIKPEGKINIFDEDKNDNYVGAFWGYNKTCELEIHEKLKQLEEKHKAKFDLKGELKSKTIKKKNFTFGITSLREEAMNFYRDYFDLMNDISPIIHINAISKVELLVRNIFNVQAFCGIPDNVRKIFYYSMSKFLLTYHTPELIKSMYNAIECGTGSEFRIILLEHLFKVIGTMEGIKRKPREVDACKLLIDLIVYYDTDFELKEKYNFVYFQNFDGLLNLLEEKNINSQNVNLIIDREEQTYKAIPIEKFASVGQKDSTESIEVRCADFLCGFIGKMMFALMNDKTIKEDPVLSINNLRENDIERKHLLSKEWFELKQKHFDLYKSIYLLLVAKQSSYWSTMTWSFCDQVCMFYSLLKYIYSYDSFEQFKSIAAETHAEYFNSACCSDLEKHYTNFYK